jgi:hypothetical protein
MFWCGITQFRLNFPPMFLNFPVLKSSRDTCFLNGQLNKGIRKIPTNRITIAKCISGNQRWSEVAFQNPTRHMRALRGDKKGTQ